MLAELLYFNSPTLSYGQQILPRLHDGPWLDELEPVKETRHPFDYDLQFGTGSNRFTSTKHQHYSVSNLGRP